MTKCLGLLVFALIFTNLVVFAAVKSAQAAGNFISEQIIVAEGDIVDVSKYAKKGPYRIGFRR